MTERMDMELHKKIRSLFNPEKGVGIYIEILSTVPLRYDVKVFTDGDEFYDLTRTMHRTDKTYFLFDRIDDEEVFYFHTKHNTLVQDYFTHKTLQFRTRFDYAYSKEAILLEFAQLRVVIEAELTKTIQ